MLFPEKFVAQMKFRSLTFVLHMVPDRHLRRRIEASLSQKGSSSPINFFVFRKLPEEDSGYRLRLPTARRKLSGDLGWGLVFGNHPTRLEYGYECNSNPPPAAFVFERVRQGGEPFLLTFNFPSERADNAANKELKIGFLKGQTVLEDAPQMAETITGPWEFLLAAQVPSSRLPCTSASWTIRWPSRL
jgi:hypothetical protein